MKIATLLISTILTSAMLASPVMAAQNDSANSATSSSSSAMQLGQTTSQTQNQQMASEIIGNINIANVALVYGMNDDASSHIAAARTAISTFNNKSAPYNSSAPMTAGKLSYKTAKGNLDYLVPVENDHFVVRTLNGSHLTSKAPDVDVTDAAIVHYKLFLDTKVADDQLAKAQAAMAKKQYDVAMSDLQNVAKGAISETIVQDKPMEAARDNLILARELLQDKDYQGASFALKHANKELAQAQKDNPASTYNASIKDMQVQIDSLQKTIAKDDPSMVKTAEMKIDGWIKDVREKIHS